VNIVTRTPDIRKTLDTVNIQNRDHLVFEWPFSGHFLSPVIKCSGFQMPGSTRFFWFSNGYGSHLILAIRKPDKLSGFRIVCHLVLAMIWHPSCFSQNPKWPPNHSKNRTNWSNLAYKILKSGPFENRTNSTTGKKRPFKNQTRPDFEC
jgi:hypothetical protein